VHTARTWRPRSRTLLYHGEPSPTDLESVLASRRRRCSYLRQSPRTAARYSKPVRTWTSIHAHARLLSLTLSRVAPVVCIQKVEVRCGPSQFVRTKEPTAPATPRMIDAITMIRSAGSGFSRKPTAFFPNLPNR